MEHQLHNMVCHTWREHSDTKLSDLVHNTKSVKYEAKKCFVRPLLSNMLETTKKGRGDIKGLICDATFDSEVSCV